MLHVFRMLAAFVLLTFGFVSHACAAQTVRGVVLGTIPAQAEAVVRHEPFDGMPSMTMPFRIEPRERLGELQPGVRIEATVDRSTEPWTLREPKVLALQAVTSSPTARNVTLLRVGDVVPDTSFVDQRGHAFRFSALRGSDVVLAFIFTRCKDPRMCPLASSKFHALQTMKGQRPLHLVEISIDPSYDRPPVLARYGRIFEADPNDWTLAVGDAEPTLDFAARFGIAVFPDDVATLLHTENTVEIDRTGRIVAMFPDADWSPREVLDDLDAQNATGFARFAHLGREALRSTVALCGAALAGTSGVVNLIALGGFFLALIYLIFRLARRLFL
jgi:protein SCO1/2